MDQWWLAHWHIYALVGLNDSHNDTHKSHRQAVVFPLWLFEKTLSAWYRQIHTAIEAHSRYHADNVFSNSIIIDKSFAYRCLRCVILVLFKPLIEQRAYISHKENNEAYHNNCSYSYMSSTQRYMYHLQKGIFIFIFLSWYMDCHWKLLFI